MYDMHRNPSTAEIAVLPIPPVELAPLTLVGVDRDHHWVDLPVVDPAELFWLHAPLVVFYRVGR